MTAPDAPVIDSIRGWLGEGPGARRLATAAGPGPRVVCTESLADDPGVKRMSGSLAQGSVTVVVLEGSVPIGSDELEMLAELPAPAMGVVFALVGSEMAGTETAGPAMAGIEERNRALLGEFTPGLETAPMVPVGQGEQQREALDTALVAAEGRMRGRDRIAEIARSVLDFEIARQRRRLAELQRDPQFGRLRAERAALLSSRSGARGAGGPSGLPAQLAVMRAGFGLVKVDLGHEIASRCRQMSSMVRDDLDAATKDRIRGFSHRLRDDLAAVGADLDRDITGRLRSVALAVSVPPAMSAVRVDRTATALEEPHGRVLAFEDRLMIVMGASAGLGLGRLATAPLQVIGVPQVFAVPIMLVLGAAAAWWIVRARASARDRQRMRQWAVEAIAEFKAQWERMLAQRALDAEVAAVGALGEEHARLMEETERRVAELDARLSGLGRERDSNVHAVKNRLAQGARLRAALAPHMLGSPDAGRSANGEGTINVDVR